MTAEERKRFIEEIKKQHKSSNIKYEREERPFTIVLPSKDDQAHHLYAIQIDWYNNGLLPNGVPGHYRLEMGRNDACQSYFMMENNHKKLGTHVYRMDEQDREKVFRTLEQWEATAPWDNDYSVLVCDGFAYAVQLIYSNGEIKRIEGTIEYPPRWKEFLKLLYPMCKYPERVTLHASVPYPYDRILSTPVIEWIKTD